MFSRRKENVLKNEAERSQERSGESSTKIRMIWQCHHITAITTSRVCLLSQSCSSRECLKNVLHLTNLHVLTSLHLKDKHTRMKWKEQTAVKLCLLRNSCFKKAKNEENVLRTFFTWKKQYFCHTCASSKKHMGCSFLSYRLHSCMWSVHFKWASLSQVSINTTS